MVTVDELVKEIEGQSEVHSAWKGSKAQTQKGTVATKGKATYSTETTGPELENKVQLLEDVTKQEIKNTNGN